MGDHSYISESVPKTIFCSDCGKNVAEKETGYHNKYYHKVVICELCGFQNQGYLNYYSHKRKCTWKQFLVYSLSSLSLGLNNFNLVYVQNLNELDLILGPYEFQDWGISI